MWKNTEGHAGTASPTSTLEPAPLTKRTWPCHCTACRALCAAADARVPLALCISNMVGSEGQRMAEKTTAFDAEV